MSVWLAILVGAAVTLFLGGYVVPRFATAYHGTAARLPWLSRQMMALGEMLAAHRLEFAIGLALLGVLAEPSLENGLAETVPKI